MTAAAHLSQLAAQVPELLNEHRSKRGRDLDICAQFFDFPAFYGEEQSSSGSRTRSVASSDPGLTSGSSEDDGAPSPGPHFDSYQSKDTIKQAKQHDDRFTLPEIRPKRGVAYPSKIHLDNAPSPTGSGTSGSNVVILSNPGSPSILDAALEENHPLHRGRRTRPLENPEKVAVMRKLGACYRCKYRKVTCDEGAPCSSCTDYAAKIPNVGCDNLAEQMCFRHKPSLIFGDIHQSISAEYSPRPTTSNATPEYTLDIFFHPLGPRSPPLSLKVGIEYEQQVDSLSSSRRSRGYGYRLSDRDTRDLWSKIVEWASSQMEREGTGSFQSTLDNLVISFLPGLPHSDLLHDLHRLRCYYKVLRQKRFAYRTHPMGELEELPADFHRFLKASLSKATAQVEDKVWEGLLDKKTKSPKSSQDRLSLWAGWMQIILLYRDVAKTNGSEESWFTVNMQRKAESLMNCAAVMYDLHFGKRKPTTSVDGMDTAILFDRVESQQVDFLAQIRRDDRMLDRVLSALLAKPQKNTTRSRMPPPQKKQRKST